MANKFLGEPGVDVLVEKIKALNSTNSILELDLNLFDEYGRLIKKVNVLSEHSQDIYGCHLISCKRLMWSSGDGLFLSAIEYFPINGIYTFGTGAELTTIIGSKQKYLGNIPYLEEISVSPSRGYSGGIYVSSQIEFLGEYPNIKNCDPARVDISYPNIEVNITDVDAVQIFESVCPPKTEDRKSTIILGNNSSSAKEIAIRSSYIVLTNVEVCANGAKIITLYFDENTNSYIGSDGIGEIPRNKISSVAM